MRIQILAINLKKFKKHIIADANASQKAQNFKKLKKRMLILSQIVYKSILSRFGLKPFSLVALGHQIFQGRKCFAAENVPELYELLFQLAQELYKVEVESMLFIK